MDLSKTLQLVSPEDLHPRESYLGPILGARLFGLRPGMYRLEAVDRAGGRTPLPALEIDGDLERDLVGAGE